jgi:hypothetical protein
MKPNLKDSSPSGLLVLSEREPSSSQPRHLVRALSARTSFETKHLHEYCFREPTPLSHDIASLLGAVRLADRAFTRHHSRAWGRSLKLELPVYEMKLWRSNAVTETLAECLQYLTGDQWSFNFVKRRRKPAPVGQAHVVSSPDTPRVFVPFSHGLDSHAQSVLLNARETLEVVPVNINSSRRSGSWRDLGRRGRQHTVSVSSQVDEPHRTEPSFRTRPFIYDMMAAYGAAMSGASRVLVPENGQGSLGGSLVPLGNEAPHRSCHPGFTSRLAHFVHALTGHSVVFEHPALFSTKGDVLRELAKLHPKSDEWLAAHPSCSYDSRHAHKGGHKVHCGLCGNCMLRRLSLHAAGIVDSTPYRAVSLRVSALVDSFEDGHVPTEIAAYRDVAHNSTRSMQRLADLAHVPNDARVWAEIDGLATYLARPIQLVQENMFSLLHQHRREWNAFLQHCGESSWVFRLARG